MEEPSPFYIYVEQSSTYIPYLNTPHFLLNIQATSLYLADYQHHIRIQKPYKRIIYALPLLLPSATFYADSARPRL